jgi:tetratricopeptide (TPR) repeat protein
MLCDLSARIVAGVFILLLAACATPQTAALRHDWPQNLPGQVELDKVVFHAQEEHQCGPAALAMALQYAGSNAQPDQLKPYLYLPEKQGSLQVEMLATARRHGKVAYVLRPELQDVLSELGAGNPVVVLQNLGLGWYPLWHYAVVIGYDRGTDEIILRSGLERRQVLPFRTFENTWARSNYWAMLALPPGKIPQSANAEAYMQSVVALEHGNASVDVWPSYEAALKRWPGNLLTQIAAGNFAYKLGRLEQAEKLFQQAAQGHPDSVAALNNLAQTLSDMGKLEAALRAARQAVALGGPLNAQASSTLHEIEQKAAKTGSNK